MTPVRPGRCRKVGFGNLCSDHLGEGTSMFLKDLRATSGSMFAMDKHQCCEGNVIENLLAEEIWKIIFSAWPP